MDIGPSTRIEGHGLPVTEKPANTTVCLPRREGVRQKETETLEQLRLLRWGVHQMKTENYVRAIKDATGGIRRGRWRSGVYTELGLEGGEADAWVEWTGLAGLHQAPNVGQQMVQEKGPGVAGAAL